MKEIQPGYTLLLEAIVNGSADRIHVMEAVRDNDGYIIDFRWTFMNDKAIDKFGDLTGERLLEYFPGLQKDEIFTSLKRVVETGVPVEYELHYNEDGYDFWSQQRVAKLNDGFINTSRDLAEEKKEEKDDLRLRQREQQAATDRYYSVFNAIEGGFCIIEMLYDDTGKAVNYRFVEVNPAFEKQTGLKNVAGKTGSELTPGTEAYWIETYDKVLQTGEPLKYENYHEGTQRWYIAYASKIGQQGSKLVAISFTDITESKNREAQQAYLLQLNDSLRSISDPVKIEEKITAVAREYFHCDRCYYCSIDDGEVTIRRDSRTEGLPSVAGKYTLSHFDLFKKVVDAGAPFIEYDAHTSTILDEPLRTLCIELQVISFIDIPVIKNDKPAGILCLVQSTPRKWTALEISLAVETAERTWSAVERANAEELMRKNEEKFRNLFNSIDTGFTIIEVLFNDEGKGTDYRFLETNPAFLKQTGLDNVTGKRVKKLLPDHEDFWFEVYGDIATSGKARRFEHGASQLKGGIWYDVYAFPVGSPEEKKVAVLFSDITRQKNFTDELSRQVALRTAALERSNEDLRQFAHVASHDLKEPVRKMRTFANRIIDESGSGLDDKTQSYLHKIDDSGKRMMSMIDAILDYSKAEYALLRVKEVDLNEILQQVETDLELVIQKKGAVITSGNMPRIIANEMLIYPLFYNLLLNALKFSKEDTDCKIDISCSNVMQEGIEYHKIMISDNGIGFRNEYREDIFKSFTRLHPADMYEGSGLGLALCKKIMERYKGIIYADGQPEKGAIFTILFPVSTTLNSIEK